MSNFEEQFVSFHTLSALLQHAENLECIANRTPQSSEQLTSIRCYEAETLDNIIGEMRCLINEIHKRSSYLKNVTAEDV